MEQPINQSISKLERSGWDKRKKHYCKESAAFDVHRQYGSLDVSDRFRG